MRDSLAVRLGGLAANLARIKSFAGNEANGPLVASLIDESKFFIEWAAPEAAPEIAAELIEMQIQMARWQLIWDHIWIDPMRRNEVAQQSKKWSEQVLIHSGLLSV